MKASLPPFSFVPVSSSVASESLEFGLRPARVQPPISSTEHFSALQQMELLQPVGSTACTKQRFAPVPLGLAVGRLIAKMRVSDERIVTSLAN